MKTQKENQQGFAHIWVLAVIVVMAISGVGAYVWHQNKTNNKLNSVSSQSEVDNLPSPLPEDLLTAEKVKELALTEKPGATVSGVELENEDGIVVYEVKIADGSRLVFNAQTGKLITKALQNDKEEVDKAIPADFKSEITFAKAREIALAQKPGGTVQKIELELEGGVVVYSVRFSDDARVDVNATTGVVVRTKPASSQKSAPSPSTSGSTGTRSTTGSGSSGSNSVSGSTRSNSGSGSHDSTDDNPGSHGGSSSGSGHSEDD